MNEDIIFDESIPEESRLISVVMPLFDEEEVLPESYMRLTEVLRACGHRYELILVNDGSRDRTAEMVKRIAEIDFNVRGISFSRNFGHQCAITAGMDYARGDAVIVIDADLQDPPEVIPQMLEKWREGYKVVYGKRTKREGETLFKVWTASAYYRLLGRISEVTMPLDAGDFRLLDRVVIEELKKLPERNRYVRGLVSWIGYEQCAVEYERHDRFAGETKYPLRRMLKLAGDGIVSFSSRPLRFSLTLGVIVALAGFVYFIAALTLFIAGSGAGISVALALMFVVMGLTLIMLGVCGQYIARIYDEAKGRPYYIVAETEGFGGDA